MRDITKGGSRRCLTTACADMGLSCDCSYDDYEWYYEIEDGERIAMTDYKCYGCSAPKKEGEHIRRVISFEINEEGDEDNYKVIGRLCEEYSGLYDSLIELGFCLTADRGFIREAMNEYRENYVNVNKPVSNKL